MASVRRSRRIWRNSFMAMAHMPGTSAAKNSSTDEVYDE
jgi:hypothetical protein